jgi:CRP-like cAMP-binding protein
MPGKRLSPTLRKELRSVSTPFVRSEGAILFRAGRPGRGAFLIRTGQVKLTLDGCAGLYPTRILRSGAVIGLPAAFSGEPYSLTAEAAKDCLLDFIPRRNLLNLLRQNPEIGFQIVRILSEEIFQMRKAAKLTNSRAHPRAIKVERNRKAAVHGR